MPANLPPHYKKLEEELRNSESNDDKIIVLKKMLALIPKHKGTDKMQAEIKAKIAKLKKTSSKKGAVLQTPEYKIERSGVLQACIIGPTNSGKSSILSATTSSETKISSGFFTSKKAIPGMLKFKDISFQLIDTPALFEGFTPTWLYQLLRMTDYLFFVLSVDDDDLFDHFEAGMQLLKDKKIIPILPLLNFEEEQKKAGFKYIPMTVIVNKTDIDQNMEIVNMIKEFMEDSFPVSTVSVMDNSKTVSETLGNLLFTHNRIIRIYTKRQGKPADMNSPFVLRAGDTVFDLAKAIHKDIYKNFKYARIWRGNEKNGERISGNEPMKDCDIIQIHAN